MDLIICVLGLLALVVDGIRCQGVYGECRQCNAIYSKCDNDLVLKKKWFPIIRLLYPLLNSWGLNERNARELDKAGLNVTFEWGAPKAPRNPEVIQQIACVANHTQPLFSSNPSLTVVGEQAKFRGVGVWEGGGGIHGLLQWNLVDLSWILPTADNLLVIIQMVDLASILH